MVPQPRHEHIGHPHNYLPEAEVVEAEGEPATGGGTQLVIPGIDDLSTRRPKSKRILTGTVKRADSAGEGVRGPQEDEGGRKAVDAG